MKRIDPTLVQKAVKALLMCLTALTVSQKLHSLRR